MTYFHELYGLTISLPFPCPFLPHVETNPIPHVTVTYGPVPKKLAGAVASKDSWQGGYCWQAAPGRFLFKGGKRSGRFLVENGCRITLHRNALAEDKRLVFHLLHSVSAALLRQRGYLVLHASTARTSAGAIAFCGESGAGKSTTLAALLLEGCAMISDDITVLRFAGNGGVETVPGPSRMHLCEDAAQGIGLQPSKLDRHPMRRAKVALTAPGASCSKAVPLRKLCILGSRKARSLRQRNLQGAEKLDALLACVYGPLLPEEHPGLFKLFSAVAEQTEISHIERPENRWTVDEILKAVLDG